MCVGVGGGGDCGIKDNTRITLSFPSFSRFLVGQMPVWPTGLDAPV